MKKILFTLLFFFNLSLTFDGGNFSWDSGADVQAQRRHKTSCPPNPHSGGGGGGGFFGWMGDAIGAIGNALGSFGQAIGNVANSVGDFFGGLFGGSEGESPGIEEGESDYGYDDGGDSDNSNNTFDTWWGDSGEPNAWNDPYFNTDDWGDNEWWVVENMGPYIETYNNGWDYTPSNQYATWEGELCDKIETPPTSNYPKSNLPCYNSFLLPYKKIIHFKPEQLALIQSFHFDGNQLEYFIDRNGNKFINGQSPNVVNNVIVSTQYTYLFICLEKINSDINLLNWVYGTTITQKQDIKGATKEIIKDVPRENLNYCFEITADQIEDCGVGKMVEARTSTGVPYCKTLKPEDCARGMGRQRDEYLPYGGLNLDHNTNMPDPIREFLKKIIPSPGPCTISFINSKLNELHASQAYQSAGDEAVKEEMEYLTVGYYYIIGALNCATDENAAKNLPPAQQYALGALHELASTIDVVQLTQGLVLMAKGLSSMVDQNVKLLISVLDQAVNDVITTGTVDYEKMFKKIVEAATSQLGTAYEKIKQIMGHLQKIYFTGCGSHQFGDGSVGDICAYRRGEMTVMALPIVITGGQWAVVKATTLAGKYLARTGKAIKLLDEAMEAGATITDDAGKIIVHETTDDLTTVVTKEADDIHFQREGNEFTPHPPSEINVPVINGRRPINHEFANGIYRTTSGYDVPFNQYGFPNFEQWTERTVRIDGMTGMNDIDFAKANKAAFGVEDATYHLTHNNGQYANYVWHHHEDAKSMMLVPKNLNNFADGGVRHTGGAAIAKHNNLLPSGATPLSFPSPPLK